MGDLREYRRDYEERRFWVLQPVGCLRRQLTFCFKAVGDINIGITLSVTDNDNKYQYGSVWWRDRVYRGCYSSLGQKQAIWVVRMPSIYFNEIRRVM